MLLNTSTGTTVVQIIQRKWQLTSNSNVYILYSYYICFLMHSLSSKNMVKNLENRKRKNGQTPSCIEPISSLTELTSSITCMDTWYIQNGISIQHTQKEFHHLHALTPTSLTGQFEGWNDPINKTLQDGMETSN